MSPSCGFNLYRLKDDVDSSWQKFDHRTKVAPLFVQSAKASCQNVEIPNCVDTSMKENIQPIMPHNVSTIPKREKHEISMKDLISEYSRLTLLFPGRYSQFHPIERVELISNITALKKLEAAAQEAKKASGIIYCISTVFLL